MLLINTPIDALMAIGRYIRTTRLQQNIMMEDLAERAGISISTLARVEKKGVCSTEALVKVLAALGSIDTFVAAMTPAEDLSIARLRELSKHKPKQRVRRTA